MSHGAYALGVLDQGFDENLSGWCLAKVRSQGRSVMSCEICRSYAIAKNHLGSWEPESASLVHWLILPLKGRSSKVAQRWG